MLFLHTNELHSSDRDNVSVILLKRPFLFRSNTCNATIADIQFVSTLFYYLYELLSYIYLVNPFIHVNDKSPACSAANLECPTKSKSLQTKQAGQSNYARSRRSLNTGHDNVRSATATEG